MAQDPFADIADEQDPFHDIPDENLPIGNTAPYEHHKKPLMIRGAQVIDQDRTPEPLKQAAKSGVNIDARRPSIESLKAGFAANPAEKDAFLTSAIATRYGQDAVTRTGPDSGQLEFYNPESGRWELAEPNAMSMLPDLIEAVPATLGAVGGGMAGSVGGPVGAAAGGAGGAAIGQAAGHAAKLKLGQAFGLNESMSNTSIAADSAKEGALAGAFDLGGSAVYGAYRGIKAVILGQQFLKPAEAAELLNAQRRADKLVAEVNSQVPSVTGDLFKPFTAQIAPDTIGGKKLLAASNQVLSDPVVGPKLAGQIEKNEFALGAYFDNTVLPNRMGLEAPHQGAEPLKTAIAGERQASTDPLAAGRDNATDAAAAQMNKIQSPNPAMAGSKVRQGIVDKYMAAKKVKNDAYAEYQAAAGYDGNGVSSIEVPISDELLAQQKALKAQIKRIPLKSAAAGKKELLLKKGSTINLADLDTMLKQLRADQRSAKRGKLNIPYNELDSKRLEETLTTMRNNYLDEVNPEARQVLEKAEHAAFEEANTFKYGLAKNLLVKEGGAYKLSDAKVIATILRNKDPRAASEISEILDSDPEAKLAAQNYIFALYRKAVTMRSDRAKPIYDKHKEFMDQYGPVIREFFDPKQEARLNELGGFAETISKNTDNLKLLNAIWNKSYKGKIDRLTAEGLTDKVFTKSFSNEDVRNIAQIAGRYSPEVLASWRAGVADKLRERMFKDGLIDGAGLTKLTGDMDTMLKLRTIFGPKYMQNLETLKKATDMVRQVPADINLPNKNTFWTDFARSTYAAPLSREGRIVSMFQNTRSRALANKIYRSLTDPEELGKLASRTRRTMERIMQINVGGTAYQNLEEMQED